MRDLQANKSNYLSLENMHLDTAEVKYLAKYLELNTSFTKVILDNTNLRIQTTKKICDMLQINKTITEIHMERNGLHGSAIKYISDVIKNNNTITKLVLGLNTIRDEEMEYLNKALKKNNTIEHLRLPNNCIRDAQFDFLEINKTITHLDLSLNVLQRPFYDSLLKNNTLNTLNIAACNIMQCLDLFTNFLEINHSITNLDLSSNEFNGTKEQQISICDALSKNDTLEILSFDPNSFSEEMLTYFLKKLPVQLFELNTGQFYRLNSNKVVEILSKYLSENSTLKSLFTCGKYGNNDINVLLSGLLNNKTLEHLNLDGNYLNEKQGINFIFEFLDVNITMKSLSLRGMNNEISKKSKNKIDKKMKNNQILKAIQMNFHLMGRVNRLNNMSFNFLSNVKRKVENENPSSKKQKIKVIEIE
eukprot:gene4892-8486_t